MANNGAVYPILNPYTPLAFLPPAIADQYEAVGYIYVATLAAYTWDWFMALPDEYQIFRKRGINPANAAYLISRIGSLGFCVTTVVWAVAPVADCQALEYVICSFYEISLPATSLLFFFRVKAVYNNSKIITIFFGTLWVAVLGLSILLMLAVKSDHIPHTQRCKEAVVREFGSVPTMVSAIYDTLVFIAISYRLISYTLIGNTWKTRARSFICGDGLYSVSRALLRGGQLYYFVTIGISIVHTVLTMVTSFPGELRLLFGPPTVALPSAMACYVFRAVLLGVIDDGEMCEVTHFPANTTIRFEHNDIALCDLGGSSRLTHTIAKMTTIRHVTSEDDMGVVKGSIFDSDANRDAAHWV